jgi:hypothetical protein
MKRHRLAGNGKKLTILTVRITGFLDFVHRSVFKKTREHNISETGSQSLLALSKGPNRVAVSHLT